MAIIIISRGTFSGGKAVAEQLAAHLGHRCLSREILIGKAAAMFHISEDTLSDSIGIAPGMFKGEVPVSAANVNYVRAALLRELQEHDMVYHGLAGDLLLYSVKKILRVRIIAPMDFRIREAMKEHCISEAKAERMITEMDSNRDKWAAVVLGTEWNDPSLFDIAINVDSVTTENAVHIITKISELPEYTPDTTTTKSLNDLALSARIWATLTQQLSAKSVQLQITADNGQITITGNVASRKTADKIISITREIEDVCAITDMITVGNSWIW